MQFMIRANPALWRALSCEAGRWHAAHALRAVAFGLQLRCSSSSKFFELKILQVSPQSALWGYLLTRKQKS
jgi:hypothetical protein